MADLSSKGIKEATCQYIQDGKISLNHLSRVLNDLELQFSEKAISNIISSNGYTASDQLPTSDFLRLVSSLAKSKQQERLLREEFRKCDTNGDGIISREEARRALEAEGLSLSQEEIEEIMKMADANGDGKVDYEEFVHFFWA